MLQRREANRIDATHERHVEFFIPQSAAKTLTKPAAGFCQLKRHHGITGARKIQPADNSMYA
jgi:hypothetical protein